VEVIGNDVRLPLFPLPRPCFLSLHISAPSLCLPFVLSRARP
jgi:hypothetical protein